MLPNTLVFLALLAAAPLPANADMKDISCKDSGQYIGGIDRTFTLDVGAPKDPKWSYTFATTGGMGGDIKLSGTYALADGLAVFTGTTDKKQAVQFALNYGFPEEKTQFNAFFPTSDKTLGYQRKLFRQVKGEWRVAEELVLSMPRTAPQDKRWEVPFTGEHTRWDEAGKPTKTKIAVTATYVDGQLQKAADHVPAYLVPVLVKQSLEAAYPDPRGRVNTGGYLRGFHPGIATGE